MILSLGFDVRQPRSGVARVIQACHESLNGKFHSIDASDIDPEKYGELFFDKLRERYLEETIQFINNTPLVSGAIYAHHFCADKAISYANSKGLRTIFHCHGIRYKHFESELNGYKQNPSKIRRELSEVDLEKITAEMDYADKFERNCFKEANVVVSPSIDETKGYLCCNKENLKIIPSVLPISYVKQLKSINKQKLASTKEKKTINFGFCGRLEYAKGFDKFLNLSEELGSTGRFEFHVAGPNYWGFEEGNNNKYYGWLSQVGLLDFFKTIDILLVPSRYEPYGLVAIEAILAGCKVIASNKVTSLATSNENCHEFRTIENFSADELQKTTDKLLSFSPKTINSANFEKSNFDNVNVLCSQILNLGRS